LVSQLGFACDEAPFTVTDDAWRGYVLTVHMREAENFPTFGKEGLHFAAGEEPQITHASECAVVNAGDHPIGCFCSSMSAGGAVTVSIDAKQAARPQHALYLCDSLLLRGKGDTDKRSPLNGEIKTPGCPRQRGETAGAQITLKVFLREAGLRSLDGRAAAVEPGDLEALARGEPEIVASAAADFEDGHVLAWSISRRMPEYEADHGIIGVAAELMAFGVDVVFPNGVDGVV